MWENHSLRSTCYVLTISMSIYSLLAAGLSTSVGRLGGVDRTAPRCADQVGPVGRVERLRSPGDRTSRPAEWTVTGTLSFSGSHWTVDNFSVSAGVEWRRWPLTTGSKTLGRCFRRLFARWLSDAKTCQLAGTLDRGRCGLGPDLPASGGWAQYERRTSWGRGPHGTSLCGSGRTRRAR
jgi:hypothetical protein